MTCSEGCVPVGLRQGTSRGRPAGSAGGAGSPATRLGLWLGLSLGRDLDGGDLSRGLLHAAGAATACTSAQVCGSAVMEHAGPGLCGSVYPALGTRGLSRRLWRPRPGPAMPEPRLLRQNAGPGLGHISTQR